MATEATSNPQQKHYESIHDSYEAHYYDPPSIAYRRAFLYEPLFAGLALDEASVADLACGSGHNSLGLREYFPNVRTTGYDISETACRDYRKFTGGKAHQTDLTLPSETNELHDAALVIGGLHHCVADLEMTMRNIAAMVRPGGHLMMMEPNDDFLLSAVRRFWYRQDRWFEADTEAALKHDEIAELARPYYEPERVHYFGGPAFYFILNSLITRVPLRAKPVLAQILFPMERLYNKLPGKAPFAAFLAVWRRTEAPV